MFEKDLDEGLEPTPPGFLHIRYAHVVIGKVVAGPEIVAVKLVETVDTPQGQEGSHFHSGIYILFADLQKAFRHIIVHTEPVLAAKRKGQLLEQVHEGAGDPQP